MAGNRDKDAGALLREMREGKGISPEQLPRAMRQAGVELRAIPSSRTVRRIEDEGVIPQVRYRFGLAQFYDRPMTAIWDIRQKAKT